MESESEAEDAIESTPHELRSDRSSRRRVRQRADPSAEGVPQNGEEGYQETLDRAAKMQETINAALRSAGGQSSG